MNWRRLLSHFYNQERPGGDAGDGQGDAAYDDRDSISPFIQKEQYLERLTHQEQSDKKNADAGEERDLIKWTRRLAYLTGALATATFLVACFSGWQAWETHQGSLDTHAALIDVQRAFVFSRDPLQQEGPNATHAIRFTVIWENSGNTPTKDLVAHLKCPRNTFAVTDPFLLASGQIDIRKVIGPKQTIYGGTCDLTQTEIALITSGYLFFYIAASVAYNDVFNGAHITEYCAGFIFSPANNQLNDIKAEPRFCDKHNCADEECD